MFTTRRIRAEKPPTLQIGMQTPRIAIMQALRRDCVPMHIFRHQAVIIFHSHTDSCLL